MEPIQSPVQEIKMHFPTSGGAGPVKAGHRLVCSPAPISAQAACNTAASHQLSQLAKDRMGDIPLVSLL
jgi:hypothetical protein